jgi:hypothetical protein
MSTPKSKKILHLPANPTPDTQHDLSAIGSAKAEIRNRKPRCDSPMNRLPDDRQAALVDFIDHHTLAEAVEYLAAAEGIKTTQSSLTKYRASYQTRQDLDKDSGCLDVNIDQSQQASHGLTREQLYDLGQERLMIRAIRLGSHTAWSKIHLLRQNQERICQNQQRIQESAEWRKLEERRVKLLEQKTAPPAKPEHKAGSGIDPEEHAAHVRRSLGLPEDYVFPGVREREEKAREQEEQEKQRRAAKRNKNTPAPVPPHQPAPTKTPIAPENTKSSTCSPGAPTGRQETTPATSGQDTQHETPANAPAPSIPPTGHGPLTSDKNSSTPPPQPPYWHPPANQAPVSNLPEERMCIAELLNVPLPGDKYLRLGHMGLELASKSKAFYPRLLCKFEVLIPEFVREVMNDIRRGAL